MAIRLSTGAQNGLAGSLGIKDLFNNGFIGVFSGGQPVDANQAETGILLATISANSGTTGVPLGTAGAGQISKAATPWSGLCVVAGVAGWFRFYDANMTTGSNGTAVRMDGNIGVSGSDMVMSNTNMVLGATTTIDQAAFVVPANA
jgi:hypothetical protein